MADNEGASRVIHDFRDSELPWTVAYSKDKNNDVPFNISISSFMTTTTTSLRTRIRN
jgi:hypothetical protein